MSDSDGDDAMAYFLPNGIADDSPPKRSALMASSSFGPIGAARFGGIYGSGAIATGSPNALDLSVPFGEPLASASGSGGAVASAATSRPNFLLSDLGGEILQSRDSDGTNNAIGGRRNPFAFSGAFASLSAAELDAQSRLASSSAGGSLYEPLNRGDVIGTQKGNSTASGFRNDAEISAPSSSSGLGSSGVYGRPTLNANAPAFMASSTQDAAPFGSSSPSAWPTMNVKPRRAPPGLSKPSKGTAASSLSGGHGRAGDGNPLSLPPGLPHPSHSAAFGGYPTSSSSMFSGDGVRHFASKLQPTFPLLSDTFRSNEPPSNQEFNSALSELNAKSLSVEEIQSNLKATALAAAHDVVEDAPIDQTPSRLSTPRKTTKSPRRTLEFKSPSTADEKRGSEQSARGPTDPRLRTPTRRNEATLSAAVLGSPLPGIRSSSDRRGRTGKEQAISENVGRNARSGTSDSSSKAGKRGRSAAQGVSAQIIGADARPANRNGQFEASSTAIPVSTSLKKQPSSTSSAGSDDQLLSAYSPAEIVEECREVQHKVKESQREPKSANRHASAKKSTTPVHSSEKRGGTRRQVYREKVVLPDTSKSIKTHGSDTALHGDSDADASGVDSQLDDTVEVDMKVTPPETKRPSSVVRDSASATSSTNAETPAVLLTDDISPENASASEAEVTANAKQPDALVSETIVDVESTSSAPVEGENMAVLNSPPATVLHKTPSTPIHFESDSGSEIPDVSARTVRAGGLNDRKTSAKESKKDKHKKERGDKKKSATPGKSTKKEKRDSSSSGKGDPVDDEPFNTIPAKKQTVPPMVKLSALLRDGRILVKRGVVALWSGWWFLCSEFADRINLRGLLSWSFSYLESFLAVVFSVILLLSLHGASFFIRLHRVAFRAVLTHRHVGFCFAFLYAFPFLVQYVFPWAPPWAPVCLWYAFLVQLFCTSGPAAMVATFRIVLPLMFLVEGISHHSFLLDLNGAELLLASFILSAMKTSNLCSPIFLLSLAVQCLSAVFLGSELVVQWFQMTLALYSLHAMAATDEDWAGLGDEEEELSCRPLSMHHSIADYNYHPAPSAPSVQKSKRLDRRALAYVRGRKAR